MKSIAEEKLNDISERCKDKLRNSRYGTDEHIRQIAERFDETTKKTFKGPNDLCVVPFGSVADKDPEYNIKSGKLKIDGYASFDCWKTLLIRCFTGKMLLPSSSHRFWRRLQQSLS